MKYYSLENIAKTCKYCLKIIIKQFLYLGAITVCVAIYMARPFVVIRFGRIVTQSIGHLAANTELYLCKKKEDEKTTTVKHIDFFYPDRFISNKQLLSMWSRQLKVLPYWTAWVLRPLNKICENIPGGKIFSVEDTGGRDINNLLDKYPTQLKFNVCEEGLGKEGLRRLGIKANSPFVCLIVRDESYLKFAHNNKGDFSYHNYRNSNIDNYIIMAKELVRRGYYVIRMGSIVERAFCSGDPMIIDYATSELRSELMDIYLCAKCSFCISTGTGLDSVCEVFRRPIVYVNFVPIGYFNSFRSNSITITKRHFSKKLNREINLSEIFGHEVAFSLKSSDFESKDVQLVENTPEEIRDVVVEMVERLEGTRIDSVQDRVLRERFLKLFKINCKEKIYLHGSLRSNYGLDILKSRPRWLL